MNSLSGDPVVTAQPGGPPLGQDAGRGPAPRVLLVDDDEMVLTVMRRLLQSLGVEAEVSTSAAEALDRIIAGRYDAVLCDMWMPGMTGKEFYGELRTRAPHYRNRIIFVTGDLASEATWDFIEERRLPYLLKPLDLRQVRRKLEEVLGTELQPALRAPREGERRRHHRVSMKASVRVRQKRWATRGPEIASVVNASKEGVYFVAEHPYRPDTELFVCFPFTGAADIEQEGWVVRSEAHPDGKHGIALALGDAARSARTKFLGAFEDRRRHTFAPLAGGLDELRIATEHPELEEMRDRLASARLEREQIALNLTELREQYEKAVVQRDWFAEEEQRLNARLQALVEEKQTMTQSVDDMQGRMEDLRLDLAGAEQVRYQATHDSLTGAWNRGAIMDVLARELERGAERDVPVGVLLVDLDHFKSVNDTHGHPAGDAVLQEAVLRMAASLRDYDSVGRYGGEEFLIVLPGCAGGDVLEKAEKIRACIASGPIDTGEAELTVTASIGAASSALSGDIATLIQSADEALYLAKRNGRNRVEKV